MKLGVQVMGSRNIRSSRVRMVFGAIVAGLGSLATCCVVPAAAASRGYGSALAGIFSGRPDRLAAPDPYAPYKWGIIYRNTIGSAIANLRGGPWSIPAETPPPYGVGSLGIQVTDNTQKVDFGNETDFAGMLLANFSTLKYWIYTGVDATDPFPGLPAISIEVLTNPPNLLSYTSFNYQAAGSLPPSRPAVLALNTWQQFDATGSGNRWNSTSPTQPCTSPCTFAQFLSQYPNSVILSVGINKGRNDYFKGAVDALQINNRVYDFEPYGVRTVAP